MVLKIGWFWWFKGVRTQSKACRPEEHEPQINCESSEPHPNVVEFLLPRPLCTLDFVLVEVATWAILGSTVQSPIPGSIQPT